MKLKFQSLETKVSDAGKHWFQRMETYYTRVYVSKVNSSEFSIVDVRVTAIVVITVPSPVAVTALSLDYECVICVFVMGVSNNWINNT